MTEVMKDLFAQINTAEDPSNMTDLEKKHIPIITAPEIVLSGKCFEVTIEVGKLLAHPNETTHYIEHIDLYINAAFICRTDLTAVRSSPTVTYCIALTESGVLRAYGSCNAHGTWESRKKLIVR